MLRSVFALASSFHEAGNPGLFPRRAPYLAVHMKDLFSSALSFMGPGLWRRFCDDPVLLGTGRCI